MIFFQSDEELHLKCAKFYDERRNYLHQLPDFQLPYWGDVAIPYNVPEVIDASPTVPTKVVNLVTKYVYTNPVCVKATKKKTFCKKHEGNLQKGNADIEKLVTKEYFVDSALNRNQRNVEVDDRYFDFR